MMNTSFQNIEKIKVIKNIKDTKFYTWDRSWVRPFESPLSVYMNFVGLNALTYGNVKRFWGVKFDSSGLFYDEFNCNSYGSKDFVKKFVENLLPEDYFYFPTINVHRDMRYRDGFYYCPECIKQGYHSLLSQMPGEHTCPIHKIPYVHTKCLLLGEKGDYDYYTNILGKFPLPPEREDLDFSAFEEYIKIKYDSVRALAYFATHPIDPYDSLMDWENISFNKREEIAVLDESFDHNRFTDSIWDYFRDNMKAVFTLDKLEYSYNCVSMDDYLDGFMEMVKDEYRHSLHYLPNLMTMACIYDYIKDVNNKDYPGNYPYIHPRRKEFSSKNKAAAKASFCYSVRKCHDEADIFNMKFIYLQQCSAVINVYPTFINTIDYKVERCMNNMKNVYLLNNRYIEPIIAAICIRDQFWYQEKIYMKHIRSKDTFDFYNEWKNIKELKPVIYEVAQREEGTISIYRITL